MWKQLRRQNVMTNFRQHWNIGALILHNENRYLRHHANGETRNMKLDGPVLLARIWGIPALSKL
jgi:hypothetical protein